MSQLRNISILRGIPARAPHFSPPLSLLPFLLLLSQLPVVLASMSQPPANTWKQLEIID